MFPKRKAASSRALRLLKVSVLLASLPIASYAGDLVTQNETPVLTNCSQVLSLSAEQAARGLKVSVTGVVTAAEPGWDGRFFVQDSTGGVFADNHGGKSPETGDLVDVCGASHPGAFAPTITKPRWKKIGTAPMPPARPVPIEQLMTGVEDSQRVEISGVVRAAEVDGDRVRVTLASGGCRLHVYLPVPDDTVLRTLVGATVRARGTAAASYNAELRHLITTAIYIPQMSDFIVEKPQFADPFAGPVLPLNNIAQYRKDTAPGDRVHVKGIVTYQRPGQDLFLKDQTGGLHVKSLELQTFAVGDTVEAIGFADVENFLPVLADAVFRKTNEPRHPMTAEPVLIAKLQAGLHHADYLSLQGNLLDRQLRPVRQPRSTAMWTKTILLLQSDNFSFTAESEGPEADPALSAIPIGSRIEVSGVCLTESGDDGKFKSLQVLLPDPGNFQILSEPSWLTPARLGIALGILFVVSVVAVSWIIMISRKNSVLNYLIGAMEKAKTELQNAHDQLEARVRERTEQLKIQIAARKESELQFKGVLAERTRLAQELHDTLEQTLASIALQLDTSAKLGPKDSNAAGYHFELARNILSQSQVDVRRSVWDLRSRALEQFNLRGALLASCKQITDGTGIRVDVNTHGHVRPLPDLIEDNLLRIAQEALTNTIKHAAATRVQIDLDYGAHNVILKIEDNGRGFDLENSAGPRHGHFGLLGITERTQRLSGCVAFHTAPNAGTIITVEIPIEFAQEIASTETNSLHK